MLYQTGGHLPTEKDTKMLNIGERDGKEGGFPER